MVNVIVPTKRTIFTPALNAHATPTFLQPVGEDNTVSSNTNSTDTNSMFIHQNYSAADNLVQGKTGNLKPDHLLPSSEELADKRFSNLLIKQPCPREAIRDGAVSPPVESKRKVLQAANKQNGETSPTVKGMIELYNRRITERQSLLTSPFKYWISEIPSSNDGIKSPKVLTSSSPSTAAKSSDSTTLYANQTSPDLLQCSQKPASGTQWLNNETKTSCLLDKSYLDSSSDTSADRVQISGGRAFKIKRAKEEFFSREQTSGFEPMKRCSNGSSDTTSHDSISLSIAAPSPRPTIVVSAEIDFADKPPNTGSRRSSLAKRESIQNELEIYKTIKKSASSGLVDLQQKNPIQPSSTDPAIHSGKSSRGIFKLFRRSKEKDKKDMSVVHRLCRHSLEVDIERIDQSKKKRPSSTSSEGPGSIGNYKIEGPDARARSTLPRPLEGAAEGGPSTMSCPSSPVAIHKNRAATWLARGKELLKGRSPSPNIFKLTR